VDNKTHVIIYYYLYYITNIAAVLYLDTLIKKFLFIAPMCIYIIALALPVSKTDFIGSYAVTLSKRLLQK